MSDLQRLEQALINADAAGDTEAATALAQELRRVTAQPGTDQGRVSTFASGVARGVLSPVPGVIGGAGALTGIDALTETAESIEQGINETFPMNPAYQKEFWAGKASQAIGQGVSMLATGGIGGAIGKGLAAGRGLSAAGQAAAATQAATRTMIGTGAAMGAREGQQEGERFGLTGANLYARIVAGAAIEPLTEKLPFGMLAETSAMKRIFGDAINARPVSSAGILATESVEEGLAQVGGDITTNIGTTIEGTQGIGLGEMVGRAGESAALGAVGGAPIAGLNLLAGKQEPMTFGGTHARAADDTLIDIEGMQVAIPKGSPLTADQIKAMSPIEFAEAADKLQIKIPRPLSVVAAELTELAATGQPVPIDPQAIRPQDAPAIAVAAQTNPETLAAVVAMTTNTTPVAAPQSAPVAPQTPAPAVTPPEIVAGVEELSDAEALAIDAELGIEPISPQSSEQSVLGAGAATTPQGAIESPTAPITGNQTQTQQPNENDQSIQQNEGQGRGSGQIPPQGQGVLQQTQEEKIVPTPSPVVPTQAAAIQPTPTQSNVPENQVQEASRPTPLESVPSVIQPEGQTQAGTPQREGQGQEVADLMAVRDNAATPDQIQRLEGQGLVERVNGQTVITQVGIQAMPETERPRLSEAERRAEIQPVATGETPVQAAPQAAQAATATAPGPSQESPFIQSLRARNEAELPAKALARWTPEVYAAAESFAATRNPDDLAPLTAIQRKRVYDALIEQDAQARAEQERIDREAEQRLSAQELEDARFVRQSTDLQAMRARSRDQFAENDPDLEREALINSPQYVNEWIQEETAKAQEAGVEAGDTVIAVDEAGETIIGTVQSSDDQTTTLSTTSGDVTVPTSGLVHQAPQSLSRKPGLAQALMESDGAALQLGISEQDVQRGIAATKRQIPGAQNIWSGSRQDFLDSFGNDPSVQDMVAQLEGGVMTEGFYVPWLQRGFILTDSVIVYQGDADRAAINGIAPAVEAAKRLIRHEVGGHGGWLNLTERQTQDFLAIARDVIPVSEMNQMIEDGYPFQDWQTNEETFRQAAEEWFSQRLGRLDRLPETGPMARFVEWLKGVWRWLTGRKGDPDLQAIKDLWRQIRMNQAAIATGRAWYSLPREGARAQAVTAQDAEYLAAVEAGDMEKAQRMVDEAAKAAGFGPEKWVHDTYSKFTQYDFAKAGRGLTASGPAIWIRPPEGKGQIGHKQSGEKKGRERISMTLFADAIRPLAIDASLRFKVRDEFGFSDGFPLTVREYDITNLEKRGFDSVLYTRDGQIQELMLIRPSQIKSADPVTYDSSGAIIPLSQRFQSTSNDIRYSRVRSNAEIAAAIRQQATLPNDPQTASEGKVIREDVAAPFEPNDRRSIQQSPDHQFLGKDMGVDRGAAILDTLMQPERDSAKIAESTPQEIEQRGGDMELNLIAHEEAVRRALVLGEAVSTAALTRYGISLPPDYRKFGELAAPVSPALIRATEFLTNQSLTEQAGIGMSTTLYPYIAYRLMSDIATAQTNARSNVERVALSQAMTRIYQATSGTNSASGQRLGATGIAQRYFGVTAGGVMALVENLNREVQGRIDASIPVDDLVAELNRNRTQMETEASDEAAAEIEADTEIDLAEADMLKQEGIAEGIIEEIANRLGDAPVVNDVQRKEREATIRDLHLRNVRQGMTKQDFIAEAATFEVYEGLAFRLWNVGNLEREARATIKAAIDGVRRQEIAEARASRLIYSTEERLRQGSKDLDSNQSGDTINKAFRDQVAKPVSLADFKTRLAGLSVESDIAERLFRTAERETADRAKMQEFVAKRRADKQEERKIEIAQERASQLIYGVEERLRQGQKDMTENAVKDTINKAFRDQVTNPVPFEQFQARLRNLRVNDRNIERMFNTAERERIDLGKQALMQTRENLLENESPHLAAVIRRIKDRIVPGISWRDLMVVDAQDGQQRARAIYQRVRQHEALRGLSSAEAAQLTRALNRHFIKAKEKALKKELERVGATGTQTDPRIADLYEKIRRRELTAAEVETELQAIATPSRWKAIRRELPTFLQDLAYGRVSIEQFREKIGRGRKATDRAIQSVIDSTPKLIQAMNLGSFNAQAFRDAVSEKFGLRVITSDQARKIQQMVVDAQALQPGLPRDKAVSKIIDQIADYTQMSAAEIFNSFWVSSVLSGGRTQFDTWMNQLNAMRRVLQLAAWTSAKRINAGGLNIGWNAITRYFEVLPGMFQNALWYLWSGDSTLLLSEARETDRFLNDGQFSQSMDTKKAERLLSGAVSALGRGDFKQGILAFPAFFIVGVRRLMQAADYFSAAATLEASIPLAIALNPELAGKTRIPSREDYRNFRLRAREILTGGREPKGMREKAEERVMAQQLLMQSIDSLAIRDEIMELGVEASYQNDPTGIGGIFYNSVLAVHQKMVASAEALRERGRSIQESDSPEILKKADAAARNFMYALAVGARALTGLQFARFAGNKTNELLGMTPLLGLARLAEKDKTRSQKAMIIMDNLVGTAIALGGIIYAMGLLDDDDDDERRGWRIEGGWDGLTTEEKRQLRAAGKQPYSIGYLDRQDGTWKNYSYLQWATSGAFATIGNLRDRKRYRPELWDEDSYVGATLAAAAGNGQALLNMSMLQNLNDIFGGNSAFAARDPVSGMAGWLNRFASNYAGGFIPRAFKDADYMMDPRHTKANAGIELWLQHVPFYRRGVGEPYLDSLGYQVELRREPWSRAFVETRGTAAHNALASLVGKGMFISSLNMDNRVVRNGEDVRPMTDAEQKRMMDVYFPLLRSYLVREGPRIERMPMVDAKEKLSNDIQRLKSEAQERAVR